jgi:hypothetical protein
MEIGSVPATPAGRRAPARRPAPGPRPSARRVRRIAVVATLVALVPVVLSYVGTMLGPSNSSLGVRSVEWLRDHGAAGIVAAVESEYYTLTAPSKGGPTLHALPAVGYGAAGGPRAVSRRLYVPGRVPALVSPALPGEGMWRAIRPSLRARPPVLVTTLRNQPDYPRVVAGLAWIDPRRTVVTLNPGLLEPSVTLPSRGPMDVPTSRRGRLLATFNSGFKLSDDHGGFALNGRTYAPLRDGQATIVGYRDGVVDVVDWTGGPNVPASVAFARQNLPLIVAGGRVSPAVGDSSLWGATVGNAILVWRSGIGVDRHGNLIYAAADDQTVTSLANTLARAGAIRAMELDINSYWVSFITYGAPGAGDPNNLLPDMNRSDLRYLSPDDRDFFAVYAR